MNEKGRQEIERKQRRNEQKINGMKEKRVNKRVKKKRMIKKNRRMEGNKK